MALDGGEEVAEMEEAATEFEKFELPLLQTVKTEQITNDIKNGNYRRYHHHCTRKLRRLRKRLNFGFGRGKVFSKKTLTLEQAQKDSRFLMLLLFGAERAWSFAMVIKDDNRRKRYILRRFSKASKLAEQLAEFSRELGADRTALEAEAYAAWMSATSLLQKENWEAALEKFQQAHRVFEGLARAFGAENRLYTERLEDLVPSIGFCRYSIARERGEDPTMLMGIDGPASPRMDDLLAAKIDAALAESRKAQAENFGSVKWCGVEIPIRTEKVREAIILANDAVHNADQETELEKKASLYDKILIAYNDAQRLVSKHRSEIKSSSETGDMSQVAVERLQELDTLNEYIVHARLRQTIARNLLLVDRHLASESKPDDLVRLYDNLKQNCQEILDLENVISHPDTRASTEAEIAKFEALRCFHLARSYQRAQEWSEAIVLFKRAESLLMNAVQIAEQVGDPSVSHMQGKIKECIGLSARAHAEGALENYKLANDVKGRLQIDGGVERKTIFSASKNNFESVVQIGSAGEKPIGVICEMPPPPQVTRCKPVAFDIAVDGISIADAKQIAAKLPAAKAEEAASNGSKQGTTAFSRWFRS